MSEQLALIVNCAADLLPLAAKNAKFVFVSREENGEYHALDRDEIVNRLRAQLAEAQKVEPTQLRFPTVLRKMWSGGEVQEWLDKQGPLYTAPPLEVFDWEGLVELSNKPEVHEAIFNFSHDPNEDNACCMLRAILKAAQGEG